MLDPQFLLLSAHRINYGNTTYKVEKGYAKISICKYLYLSIGICAITFEQFFGETKTKQNSTTNSEA